MHLGECVFVFFTIQGVTCLQTAVCIEIDYRTESNPNVLCGVLIENGEVNTKHLYARPLRLCTLGIFFYLYPIIIACFKKTIIIVDTPVAPVETHTYRNSMSIIPRTIHAVAYKPPKFPRLKWAHISLVGHSWSKIPAHKESCFKRCTRVIFSVSEVSKREG